MCRHSGLGVPQIAPNSFTHSRDVRPLSVISWSSQVPTMFMLSEPSVSEIGNLGNVSLSFVGTWLDQLITDNGLTTRECVKLFGAICGTPNPEWRHTLHLNYQHPSGLGFAARWRYFSAVNNDGSSTRPADLRIPAQQYFDLTLTARIGDHYNFRLGVNNIFDRNPPIVGSNACPAGICNGNTYTQVYDGLGRYIFAGVTLDF